MKPKWSSLKIGDIIMEWPWSKEPCILVKEIRFESVIPDYRLGNFLNLTTGGMIYAVDLDDISIDGMVLRAKQEKKDKF